MSLRRLQQEFIAFLLFLDLSDSWERKFLNVRNCLKLVSVERIEVLHTTLPDNELFYLSTLNHRLEKIFILFHYLLETFVFALIAPFLLFLIQIFLVFNALLLLLQTPIIQHRLAIWLVFCDGCNLSADLSACSRLRGDRILLIFRTVYLLVLKEQVRLFLDANTTFVGDHHQVTIVPSNIINLLSLKLFFVHHPLE